MAGPYPLTEPNGGGFLDVGGGHRLHWEERGNPAGKPAIVLHGGPGYAPWTGARRLLDPERYRIIELDQRMAGRSMPSAGDPMRPVIAVTTHDLVADLERLRARLGIERWLVLGGSWGVTLGLAYAERHPAVVDAMVLVSITLTRSSDVRWLYHDAGRFFPDEWQRFRGGAAAGLSAVGGSDLVAAYHHLLHEHPDLEAREQAARDWCAWEEAVVSLETGWTPNPRFEEADFRMTFARLVTHVFHHAAWLGPDELLANAGRLAGIPGVLVHGRLDISSPPDVAWQLHRAWPGSELHLVPTGHVGGDPMVGQILAATDRFAGQG